MKLWQAQIALHPSWSQLSACAESGWRSQALPASLPLPKLGSVGR